MLSSILQFIKNIELRCSCLRVVINTLAHVTPGWPAQKSTWKFYLCLLTSQKWMPGKPLEGKSAYLLTTTYDLCGSKVHISTIRSGTTEQLRVASVLSLQPKIHILYEPQTSLVFHYVTVSDSNTGFFLFLPYHSRAKLCSVKPLTSSNIHRSPWISPAFTTLFWVSS